MLSGYDCQITVIHIKCQSLRIPNVVCLASLVNIDNLGFSVIFELTTISEILHKMLRVRLAVRYSHIRTGKPHIKTFKQFHIDDNYLSDSIAGQGTVNLP